MLQDTERHFLYFQMSAARFDDLVHRISPFNQHAPTYSTPISVLEKLAVTLRVLVSGSSLAAMAAGFMMGTTMVTSIILEVSEALWLALKDHFVALQSPAHMLEAAQDFWRLWNFPHCVGAIGGRLVKVRAPGGAGSDHSNHGGGHTFVLMAVCDARYPFTMVDVGGLGEESDGGLFDHSHLGSALREAHLPGTNTSAPYVFVGGAVFPLQENLMPPHAGMLQIMSTMQK